MSSDLEPQVPPIGEEIHLPEGSILPLLLTVGITIALVGVTVSPILIVIGLVLSVTMLFKWIKSARHEFDELPPDAH